MNAKNILEDLKPVVCPVPKGTRPEPRSNEATMSPFSYNVSYLGASSKVDCGYASVDGGSVHNLTP